MFPLFDPTAVQRAQQIGRALQPAPQAVPPTPVGMELSPIVDSARQIPQEAFYPPPPIQRGTGMGPIPPERVPMDRFRRGYSPGLQPPAQMPMAQANQGRGQFSGQVQYASAPWSGGQAPQPQYQPQPPLSRGVGYGPIQRERIPGAQESRGMGGGWGTNRNPQWGGGGGWQPSQPSGGDPRTQMGQTQNRFQARASAGPARQF